MVETRPLNDPSSEELTEDIFHKYYGKYPFVYTLKKYGVSNINNIDHDTYQKIFNDVGGDNLLMSLLYDYAMVMVNQEFGFKSYLSITKYYDSDYYVVRMLKEDEEMFTDVLPPMNIKYINELNFYLHCYNKIFETNEYYTNK